MGECDELDERISEMVSRLRDQGFEDRDIVGALRRKAEDIDYAHWGDLNYD